MKRICSHLKDAEFVQISTLSHWGAKTFGCGYSCPRRLASNIHPIHGVFLRARKCSNTVRRTGSSSTARRASLRRVAPQATRTGICARERTPSRHTSPCLEVSGSASGAPWPPHAGAACRSVRAWGDPTGKLGAVRSAPQPLLL